MRPVSCSQDIVRRILDDSVDALEQALCIFTGADHAVAVDCAYSGLVLALQVAGVTSGDQVFLPALAGTSVLQAVTSLSAQPLFVDINPNTYLLDPFCLDYLIGKCIRTKKPLPRVLICCNLFGAPCSYPAIEDICKEHDILLIEYAAYSLGASIAKRHSGTFGHMSVIAILEDGNPLLGEDGAVCCKSSDDAEALRQLRSGFTRQLRLPGVDDNPTLITKELARKKLGAFAREQKNRAYLAGLYREGLTASARTQQTAKFTQSAWKDLAILLPNGDLRNKVIEILTREHIPCHIPFDLPLHRQTLCGGSNRTILVNAESVCGRLLCLPMHPYLSAGAIQKICAIVNGALTSQSSELTPSSAG